MTEWISVKDRLPAAQAKVLATNGYDKWFAFGREVTATGETTYWMVVPEPPVNVDVKDERKTISVTIGGIKIPDAVNELEERVCDLERQAKEDEDLARLADRVSKVLGKAYGVEPSDFERRLTVLEHRFLNHRHSIRGCDEETNVPLADYDEEYR